MEIFQSWADIVIMLVIAIAYVWTTVAQQKVINAKNETIKSLQAQIDAAKTLTDIQGTNFNTYRDMIKLNDIQQHIDIKVSVQLSDAVDRVIKDTAHIMATDSKIFERVVKEINEDTLKFGFRGLNFVVYVIQKNNFTDEGIKWLVKAFYPDNPGVETLLLREMTKFRAEQTNRISEPEKQIDPKKD